MMQGRKYVGERVKRTQVDPALLTGKATYVNDIFMPGMLHMQILRSPYAHARIKSVDTKEAETLPGVVRVLTGKQLVEMGYQLKGQVESSPGLKSSKNYSLAVDKVRFAGQAVAAVAAENRYAAEDAVKLINVEYEPLPVVANAEKGMEPSSPLLYEEWKDNILYHVEYSEGDVEKSFKEADIVISDKLEIQRYTSIPMETRGYVASYEPATGNLTMWASDQTVHALRSLLSDILHIPGNKIRVIQPFVGGAFGTKISLYPEEALVCIMSIKTERPVKWIESRQESFLSCGHARQQVAYFDVAAKKDGTISGIKLKVIADLGTADPPADGGVWQVWVNVLVAMPGPYKIRNYEAKAYAVVTNKMTWNAHRGFGKAEANWIYERVIDIVAKRLEMDPSAVRLKNFIQPHEFPYETATGALLDSGNYPSLLKKALDAMEYQKFKEQQEQLRKKGRYLGLGITVQIEPCASSIPGTYWMGYDGTTVRIEAGGEVTVLTGITSPGSGNETTIAQVVADELGAKIEDIWVVQGDTLPCPFGLGNYSSRSTIYGASSAVLAAREIREKMVKVAANVLKTRTEDLEATDSRIQVKGVPGKGVSFREVAQSVYRNPFVTLPDGVEAGLVSTRYWKFPDPAVRHVPDAKGRVRSYPCFPNASNAALVEVDVETGQINILRYVSVHDCGTVINPMIVEAQVHGGSTHGIGGTLFEELVYDENGQLLTTTFADYMIPTALEVPNIEVLHQETPSPWTLLGSKGCGEGGAIGTAACVAAAVEDALEPFQVKVRATPLTPNRIWQLIQQGKKEKSA